MMVKTGLSDWAPGCAAAGAMCDAGTNAQAVTSAKAIGIARPAQARRFRRTGTFAPMTGNPARSRCEKLELRLRRCQIIFPPSLAF
jgi:hypothetical protein